MARTLIAANAIPGIYATAPQLLTFTAADVANGNCATFTGRLLLLIWNNSATTTYTVTVTSIGSNLMNRTGDLTQANLAANSIYATQIFPADGWMQSTQQLYFSATNASVQFALLNIPAGG